MFDRMSRHAVNTACPTLRARAGGPGHHQRAEARQGTVGTMPSRPVKTAAGDVMSPAAFVSTGFRRMPDRWLDQPALQQGSAEQAGSSQQLAQPLVLPPWWARRPENRPRRARRCVGAVPQQAGSAPQAGSAAQQAGSAAAQAGSAAQHAGSAAAQAGSAQAGAQSQLEAPRRPRPAAEAVSATIRLTATAHRTVKIVGRRIMRFSS